MEINKTLFKLLTLDLFLLISFMASAQSEETKAEIRINIDWMVNEAGTAAPAKLSVWNHMVPVGAGIRVPRGPINAPDCVNNAVLFALAGELGYALEWLQAGQAHNGDVMQLFANNRDYAIEYAVSKYWRQALKHGGLTVVANYIGIPKSYVEPALAELKKHNPKPMVEDPKQKKKEDYGGPREGGKH